MFHSRKFARAAVVVGPICTAVLLGCRGERTNEPDSKPKEASMAITVKSEAFGPNEPIPKEYTGDGRDASPPLSWSGVPEGAKELALIVDDPDAPQPEPWVHWVLYKIPADVTSLPAGVPDSTHLAEPKGALQGTTSFDAVGYGGPAPPKGHGTHHYRFRLYALDTELPREAKLTADQVRKNMQGHVLAEGELVGTYER